MHSCRCQNALGHACLKHGTRNGNQLRSPGRIALAQFTELDLLRWQLSYGNSGFHAEPCPN